MILSTLNVPPIKITSFCYDTTYSLSTYDQRSSINTVHQNLPPFFVGNLTYLQKMAARWRHDKKYEANRQYSICIKTVQSCGWHL